MTTQSKDCRGNWRAEDMIPLEGGRTVEIVTHKVYSGALLTTAQAGVDDGSMFTYTMYEDYRKDMIAKYYPRITAKIVAEQHAAALKQLETIKAAIAAHYTKVTV